MIFPKMKPGIVLKHLLSLLEWPLNIRRLKQMSGEQYLILTYHRVLPISEIDVSIEPGMFVTPATLKCHIRFLKRYFDIIAIDKLDGRSCFTKDRKPRCILTFDDGWLDFYTYAWPILSQEKVPAVVYLPTALIGTDAVFWTERLANLWETIEGRNFLIRELSRLAERKGKVIHSSSSNSLGSIISELKDFPHHEIERLLSLSEEETNFTSKANSRSFMNWQEVRELYNTGLVSFGSHTVNHAILPTLSGDEIREELQASKKKLKAENVVGNGLSFCYPNGNYNERIVKMMKECGYVSAMTCNSGWNWKGGDLYTLKRISIHNDVSSTESLLAYRLIRNYR